MIDRTMKRFGLFALLVAFLAPLALQATVLEQPISITGYEIGDSGVVAAGKGSSSPRTWNYGDHKSAAKWTGQMEKRGWTESQIDDAMRSGQRFEAPNNVNHGNGATRYVNPDTGRSIVVDNKTGQLLHVGGDGYGY